VLSLKHDSDCVLLDDPPPASAILFCLSEACADAGFAQWHGQVRLS